ncbi:hypothetical protein BgiMline_035617 [Biomphalaria glabrata]|nr:hypothetical protein BgiMline_030924 [Biomphalaria glabrata]
MNTYFALSFVVLYSPTDTVFQLGNLSRVSDIETRGTKCYEDGFQPWHESLIVSLNVCILDDPARMPPLIIYRMSETDKTKTLICFLEFKGKQGGRCKWWSDQKDRFDLLTEMMITSEWSNTRLIIQHKFKDAPWEYISETIIVHHPPEISVRINGISFEHKKCFFDMIMHSKFLVDFCVNNLKSPRLEISWLGEAKKHIYGDCISESFVHTKADEQIEFEFMDSCQNIGSFTCKLADPESTTQPVTTEQPNEPPNDDLWWFKISLVFSGIFLLAGLLCFIYTHRVLRDSSISDSNSLEGVPKRKEFFYT